MLALIAAFGLPSDPVRARRELEEQQRIVPLGLGAAHIVQAEDQRPELRCACHGLSQRSWSCRLEDGDERSGRVVADVNANVQRFALALPGGLPLGYHRLEVEAGGIKPAPI